MKKWRLTELHQYSVALGNKWVSGVMINRIIVTLVVSIPASIHPPTPWHREWASTVELIRGYHGVRIRWPWIGWSVWVVRKGISSSSNKIVSIVFNYSNRISDRKEICTLNDADRVEDLDL